MPSESTIAGSTQPADPEPALLPFAEKEYVDSRRACKILGVSPNALGRLAESGYIQWIAYGKSSWKRVNYHSIVAYCDHLRRLHHIPDRRPPLGRGMRYRDVDLLPFSLAETATTKEAMQALGYQTMVSLVKLIEEGRFEAYQVAPNWNWRISRPSLLDFIGSPTNKSPRPARVAHM